MVTILAVCCALLAAVVGYVLSTFLALFLRQARSPLRNLNGPASPSFFMGNLREMHDMENNNLVARWENQFGSTFVYRGFVGGHRLMTTDPAAVSHIMGRAYDYPKPEFVRDSLASMASGREGLLTVEGEVHRRQRKILNPAFSTTHIRTLSPFFWVKAAQLRNMWLSIVDASSSDKEDGVRIDILPWLNRATLDVIGEAGFGYRFNSLSATAGSSEGETELAHAFSVIFSAARQFRIISVLQAWFPVLRKIHRNSTAMKEAHASIRAIGLSLIRERQSAVVSTEFATPTGIGSAASAEPQKAFEGRDLLSVLIRSNLSAEPSQRLSLSETLCQIATFITAGHETTSTALTWTLYALARAPDIQSKLREQLKAISVDSSDPSKPPAPEHLDVILSCTYLDYVVREALRLHAPVTSTMRVASADDVIPVSKPFYDRHGSVRTSIHVKKGDIITIPIQAMNKNTEVWGDDAAEFRPERWARQKSAGPPGLWANMLTFGNGNSTYGTRACIGFRFAINEIKIFLFVLVRDIEFLMDESIEIEKKVNVVARPWVKSEPDMGNQMPLYLRRVPP
ncbi:hypothetical protein POSPLADRAFT_1159998 [Postia placenta MAD-698-R-SB12]|uniref:Cytochrome P450 n=1 Tax=Postia placenta MAD-698-R-SB12 TaxID=670580 RepID=A0A1X6MJX3_9APHY|nr:hypothetical protein POSPLADRAFT_1159998 [Postia placenta MAD-698-R-SB12]OSX56492.1 hypothetical protein POSPLADRAFT_1159998 [Postia placenta MAD-698-R-SB12]